MKKKVLLLMGIFSISILPYAQVGINTKIPQALLHIDGNGDTSSTNNIADDVTINNQGNVAIGTLSATAKVEINVSGAPAMRIVDGTEGLNKILKSDNNGNTEWVKAPSTDGKIYNIAPATPVTYPLNTRTLMLAIPITETGNFLVYIRWWGISNGVNALGQTAAWFYCLESTSNANIWAADAAGVQDQTEYSVVSGSTSRFCFGTSLFMHATAGNYLKIYIEPSIGGNWIIGSVSDNILWNPSVIVYRV